MTPQEIELIEGSFASVAPLEVEAAALFYGRLFEMAPEVRPLFAGDMTEQGAKLMMTLAVVVNGLRDVDKLLPVVQNLARRHVGFGVRPEHYPTVGAALLWTLEQGLGEAFTPATEAAWQKAYGTLAGVMVAAAYGDPEAAG
ncbi:MAG: globin family protein [Rhodospirillales bacterium]